MMKQEIPIFFATDDNYIPFLGVALCSLISNASKDFDYKILILNSGIKEENISKIKDFENENFQIEFVNVNEKVAKIANDLSYRLRDYYSNSIYYRIFISSLFPNYKKVLYIDADIVLVDDISKLFLEDLGDNLLGAVTDDVVNENETFRKYANIALGIDAKDYFNSGVLVMNLDAIRKEKIEEKFVHLLSTYNFNVIAPDQDYLNYLCRGKVKYLHKGWDRMALIPDKDFDERELHLVHFNMFQKPWNYSGVPYENEFWKYASKTPFYEEIKKMKADYTEEERIEDENGGINLIKRAEEIIESKNTFHNVLSDEYLALMFHEKRSIDDKKLRLVENIRNAIEEGNLNKKIEEGDPILTDEQREKIINQFDNLKTSLRNRTQAYLTRNIADVMTEVINRETEIVGLENIEHIDGGAIITSNHFSKIDNTIIRYLLHKIGRRKQRFYIIIQETNVMMPGSLGWLMRNCYTIPISKNADYMINNFAPSLEKILKNNDYVLIYPEEEMWFNYRKPRELKIGAYHYAAKFDVPIIPCFIEIIEKDTINNSGFYDLKYRLHVLKPIYPDTTLPFKERKEKMRDMDYEMRVHAYEEIYGRKLTSEFNPKEDIAGWRDEIVL